VDALTAQLTETMPMATFTSSRPNGGVSPAQSMMGNRNGMFPIIAPGAVAGSLIVAADGPLMTVGVRRPGVADVRALIVEAVVFGVVALACLAVNIGPLPASSWWAGLLPPRGMSRCCGSSLHCWPRPCGLGR
jgi:hypothetical protein